MDLEQYGVWVKAGPEDVTDDSEEMFTLSDVGDDITEETFVEPSDLTSEEEDLLASLEETVPEDDDQTAFDQESAAHDSADRDTQSSTEDDFSFSLDESDEELAESLTLDDFSIDDMSILDDDTASDLNLDKELELEDSGEELPELDTEIEDAFDDVGAVADVMTGQQQSRGGRAAAAEPIAGIESELASIKAELHALRQELAEIRSSGAAARPVSDAAGETEEVAGFFEEDEDETIALTDDELDNILNTAQFTEELGKPSEVDDIEVSAEPATSRSETPEMPDRDLSVDELTLETLEDEDMLDLSPAEDESAERDESLHDGDILSPSPDDQQAILESAEEPSPSLFTGTDSDVDSLADMDIDSELAGIEELRDDDEEESKRPASADSLLDDLDELEEIEIEAVDDSEEGDLDAEIELGSDETVDVLNLDGLGGSAERAGTSEAEEPEMLELDLDDLGDADDEVPLDLSPGEELTPSDSRSQQIEDERDLDLDLDSGPQEPATHGGGQSGRFPSDLRDEIRAVLQYMDQLLESLPEEKIEEFARSEHFEVYKRLFEELGLETEAAG